MEATFDSKGILIQAFFYQSKQMNTILIKSSKYYQFNSIQFNSLFTLYRAFRYLIR